MEPIRLVQFDIRGTNPINTIQGEEIKLLDKTCPWVIPNGSPFFAEEALTTLYNQAGGELKLGRDYTFEEEFVPFCAVTGRSICCFIKLSDEILRDNAKITADYQSIGAYFVPRNDLQEWLDSIRKGVIPVPWSKVLKVPETLPSEYHLHNVKTEVTDWFELTFFFTQLAAIQSTRDVSANDDVTVDLEDAYRKLMSTRDNEFQRLLNHDSNYSAPHHPSKSDIQLGNLDNFATATLAEDLAGARNDVFSTPEGIQQTVGDAAPAIKEPMRSGILPVSYFGTASYNPPLVSGSFEALGSETECSAMTLENDGSVMVLSNHYDGRTRGLYFTKVEGYNTDTPKHTPSAHRYDPPSLASANVKLNRVVMGSGPKVIMAGVDGTPDWFVALTNGTLDPLSHAFVKCDVSALAAFIGDVSAPGYSSADLGVIHHMGDYLVLVQTYNAGVANTPTRQAFFRVLTADVLAGKNVVWTRFNITYVNWNGATLSNQQYMEVGNHLVVSGKITRVGACTCSPEVTQYATEGRVVSLSAPKAAVRGLYNMSFLVAFRMSYLSGIENKTTRHVLEVTHDFNPATGIFTAKAKTAGFTYNFLTGTTPQADQYASFIQMLTFGQQPATVILPTGELLSSVVLPGPSRFPVRLVTVKVKGRNTPEIVLNGLFAPLYATVDYRKVVDPKYVAPTLSGVQPAGLIFQPNGELYSAVNPTTQSREIFYRQVSGQFQTREEVKNQKLGAVNARPVSDDVYRTNISYRDPAISITGTQGFLDGAGQSIGVGSFTACAYSSVLGVVEALPVSLALKAPFNTGALISFARTVAMVLTGNPNKATYAATSFYGMRQEIIDLLKVYVPSTNMAEQGWCFTLYMLTDELVGKTGFGHLAIIQLCWRDDTTGFARTQLILATPILEAPNEGHPNIYLITGLQILDTPPHFKSYPTPFSTDKVWAWFRSYREILPRIERPIMQGYIDNWMMLKCFITGGYHIEAGALAPLTNIFDVDLVAKKFSNIATNKTPIGFGDHVAAIPKVGLSDYTFDVIKGTPPIYTPPSPPMWQCRTTGATTTTRKTFSGTQHYTPPSPYLVPSFVSWRSEGVSQAGSWSCDALGCPEGGSTGAGMQGEINAHYRYLPPVDPPLPTPEKWTCKVSGTPYEDYRLVGVNKIPKILQYVEGSTKIVCKSCNTVFAEDFTPEGYLAVRDSHFTYTPEQGSPVVPGTPDETYIGLPAGEFHAHTGGGAAIARKTSGGVVSYYLTASEYPGIRWVVLFQEAVPMMINGMFYTMPSGSIDLRDIDPDPRNKVFYIYASVEDGGVSYVFSTTPLRKTGSLLLVASLITNDKQILTITRNRSFVIGDLHLSGVREGGIIPVSSGFPQNEGTFAFLRQSELLP